MKIIKLSTALLVTAVLCACDTTNERKIDSHIGKAAADLVRAQTLNPEAAANPRALAPDASDGQRLKAAMDNYHKDVPALEQKVTRPIVFEVGGGGGSNGANQ